ncbi:MAG TPA: efflux RND transporter periplasmic adaptor subunit [Thermoanaerobaculia bacterium]
MSEPPATAPRAPWLRRRRILLVLVLAGAAAALAGAWLLRRGDEVRYFAAKVERGEIRDTVEATGTVSAVITVQVGSQVSGAVAKLNADFNSRVHRGDVIALIDPALFQGALLQASADLENAKANVVAAEANLAKARAAAVQTKADYERAAALSRMLIETRQALDLAQANYEAAKAGVEAAAANVAQARAQVSQKAAAVSVARTNLDYTVIRSPIDGTVVARNVDVGQTVAASLQAPTIFTIAQDLAKMQVYTKVDESEVGRIGLRQPVTFKVDAFPHDLFRGVVSQLRMNPTTIQNVVTYDAIIDFANPELKLFPGMTAYVTIPVATAENVVKVPNAALRYKPPMPPEAVRAIYAEHGIDAGRPSAAAAATAPAIGPPARAALGAAPRRQERAESAVVWKLLPGDTVEPVEVLLGITDHTYTEVVRVIAGALAPGDDVVTSSVTSKAPLPGAQGGRR